MQGNVQSDLLFWLVSNPPQPGQQPPPSSSAQNERQQHVFKNVFHGGFVNCPEHRLKDVQRCPSKISCQRTSVGFAFKSSPSAPLPRSEDMSACRPVTVSRHPQVARGFALEVIAAMLSTSSYRLTCIDYDHKSESQLLFREHTVLEVH